MGIFTRRSSDTTAGQRQAPAMGPGRRLRTDRSLPQALKLLEDLLASYRQPPYRHMPHFHRPGWTWLAADQQAPTEVVSFDDVNDDFMLAAFWAGEDRTEWALFPLGSGDDRLNRLPLIGNWKARDASLASIGTVPGGSIGLTAPPIDEDYLSGLLATGGARVTRDNVETIGTQVAQMLLIKAYEFLSTKDRRIAERFAEDHQRNGTDARSYAQSILDDLVATAPGVLPYVQGLPDRIRAIILESDSGQRAPVWAQLER